MLSAHHLKPLAGAVAGLGLVAPLIAVFLPVGEGQIFGAPRSLAERGEMDVAMIADGKTATRVRINIR